MIASVDGGYSKVTAADGMLSQPSNQQSANPSAQARKTPVDNPVENRVNGPEQTASTQNRAGEGDQASTDANIEVRA